MNKTQRGLLEQEKTKINREIVAGTMTSVGLFIFMILSIPTIILPILFLILLAIQSSTQNKRKKRLSEIEFILAGK